MKSATGLSELIVAIREIANRLDAASAEGCDGELEQLYGAIGDLQLRASQYLPSPTRANDGGLARPGVSMSHEVERSLRITQESVDGAPIGIFRLDSEGKVLGANQEACRSLGYTREELQSLRVYDFDLTLTPEGWEAHRRLTRPTGARTFTTTHRRKDGTIFPVEVSVKQFVFDDELYSMSFVKDITERITAEKERAKLESRMLQAQKLESLGVLAGGIAHDFNNLLMVIIGNLELSLTDGLALVGAEGMLRDADQAARQAADLCRQLLMYAGKGNAKVEPVDLGRLLRDQAQMLEVSASKSIRLMLNLADGLPLINADVTQLRQVFMNLIINASDAIGQSPGVISITTSSLSCDSDYLDGVDGTHSLTPGRYVSVEVSDTGCGMEAAVRARIFDPFFSTKTAGRGLGLAAVRGIVSNHGGGIRVYSEPGKGTTFRILFPVPKALAAVPETAALTAWQGSGVVLLIDDEAALRSLGSRMLARLGFASLLACNGVEGLALFKEHRAEIQYVLLDWTMPEMDGDETFRELRRLDPDLRVILASGHAPDDVLRRIGGRRVSALVRKPYTLDELADAFQKASSR